MRDVPLNNICLRLFLDKLSYWLGIRKHGEQENSNNQNFNTKAHSNVDRNIRHDTPLLNKANNNSNFFQKFQTRSKVDLKTKLVNESEFKNGISSTDAHIVAKSSTGYESRCKEADLLLSKIDTIITKLRGMDDEDKVITEWRIVANTIDRCLLIFFALTFLITMLSCFSTSPGYVK